LLTRLSVLVLAHFFVQSICSLTLLVSFISLISRLFLEFHLSLSVSLYFLNRLLFLISQYLSLISSVYFSQFIYLLTQFLKSFSHQFLKSFSHYSLFLFLCSVSSSLSLSFCFQFILSYYNYSFLIFILHFISEFHCFSPYSRVSPCHFLLVSSVLISSLPLPVFLQYFFFTLLFSWFFFHSFFSLMCLFLQYESFLC
jgi:hypothetical protein